MTRRALRDVLVSGNLAGAASALAAALAGWRGRRRAAPPVSAIGHIVTGLPPERHADGAPLGTLQGLLVHQVACVFWAVFFESLFGRRARGNPPRALAGGAAIAAAAYVTDYHVVPPRFCPGFEVVLSRRSMFWIYAALGLGFAATAIMRASPPSGRRSR